jgi:hypothetical protein
MTTGKASIAGAKPWRQGFTRSLATALELTSMPPPVQPDVHAQAMTVKELRDHYCENIRLTGLAMLGAPMTVMRWPRGLSRFDLAWS